MFSLIITIIAIALVAALALATLYYGGTAFDKSASRAEAAKLLIQGQQLLGAADLYFTEHRTWPTSVQQLVDDNYLKQIPLVQGQVREALAGSQPWVMPLPGVPLFVSQSTVTSVCRSVNQQAYGRDGILKSASSSYLMQCYGQGVGSLLTVVGRTAGDLQLVAASAASTVVMGDVLSTGAPASPLSSDWLVAPGTVLSGSGATVMGPSISFDGMPLGALVFPDTVVSSASAPLTVVIRNNGDLPLNMGTGASVPAPYSVVSDSCSGITLALAQTCSVSVVFTPTSESTFSDGSYQMTFPNAEYALPALPLEGTGVAAPPDGTADVLFEVGGNLSGGLTYPSTEVGSSSAPQVVVIRNNTAENWTFGANGVTVPAPYTIVSNTCASATVAPLATCSVSVVFSPTAPGTFSGGYKLSVITAESYSGNLPLAGTASAVSGAGAVAQLSVLFLDFGNVATNTTETRPVTLSNPGTGVLVLTAAPEVTGDLAFGAGTTCGASLAVNESCVTNVQFAPTVVGALTGTLTYPTAVAGAPTEVALSGNAYNPVSLAAGAVPPAKLNQPYSSFNFSSFLTVSNESTPNLSQVTWSATGALPAGLSFTNGMLSGTPTAVTAGSGTAVQVLATYKNNMGQQVYTIQVGDDVLDVIQISGGGTHTCAVTPAGGAKCWGDNSNGQLGDGTKIGRPAPVNVSGMLSGVASISAGPSSYTCAITTSGGAKCWGANGVGQLGNGSTGAALVPGNVSGMLSGVASISTGEYHACAVSSSGGAKCWGYNYNGQLGNGSTGGTGYVTTPVNVSGMLSGVASISAGSRFTCAVTSASGAKCWGLNSNGQLGDSSTTQRSTPVNVTGLTSGVASISAGQSHACVVTLGGGARCWGLNANGRLGDNSTTQRTAAVDVSGLTAGVSSISAGFAHTCALTTAGGAKCWGINTFGQLGDASSAEHLAPVDVLGLSSGVASVSTGYHHSCAMTTAGGAKCWGLNTYGQLGDKTATQRGSPVNVSN